MFSRHEIDQLVIEPAHPANPQAPDVVRVIIAFPISFSRTPTSAGVPCHTLLVLAKLAAQQYNSQQWFQV